MNQKLNGIILSVGVGALAYFLAPFLPFANSIILALLFGIVISNSTSLPKTFNSGITFSSKTILEIAIIFLGFGISFQDIAHLGWEIVGVLFITILVVLIATFYLSKLFSCGTSTGYLIGFGTAICGSNAIAALAPYISKNKNDVGIAIAIINLFGLMGMLVFPLVLNSSMLVNQTALLIGGTLHGVSNVAGAGYALNEAVGDMALTIKLGRVALLAPALVFFNFLLNKEASIRENLKLPYYIIGFILATGIVTFFKLPPHLLSALRLIGTLLLTVAMAAIGMNIRLKQLYENGKIALGFGMVIFVIQIAVIGLFTILL